MVVGCRRLFGPFLSVQPGFCTDPICMDEFGDRSGCLLSTRWVVFWQCIPVLVNPWRHSIITTACSHATNRTAVVWHHWCSLGFFSSLLSLLLCQLPCATFVPFDLDDSSSPPSHLHHANMSVRTRLCIHAMCLAALPCIPVGACPCTSLFDGFLVSCGWLGSAWWRIVLGCTAGNGVKRANVLGASELPCQCVSVTRLGLGRLTQQRE